MSKTNSNPEKANPVPQKEKQKKSLGMAGGFVAGVMAAAATNEFQENPNVLDLFKVGHDEQPTTDVNVTVAPQQTSTSPLNPQFASGDFDNMSFGNAFEAARAKTGPGGVFSWHGQLFNTYTGAEWGALSEQQKADFVEHTSDKFEPDPYHAPETHASNGNASDEPSHAHTTKQEHVKPENEHSEKLDGEGHDIYDSLTIHDKTESESAPKPHGPNATQPDASNVTVQESAESIGDAVVAENTSVVAESNFAATPDVIVLQELKNEDPNSKVHMSIAMVGNDAGLAGDVDGDGKIDMVIIDDDQNGKVEKSYHASMHDGKLDAVAYDTNQDGLPDEVDPLGAPPEDNFDINNPNTDDFDPNADVSSWKE